jgi:hypothetical protein
MTAGERSAGTGKVWQPSKVNAASIMPAQRTTAAIEIVVIMRIKTFRYCICKLMITAF